MKSTSLPDVSHVQFNLIDSDLIKLLDEYTYVELVKIPCYRRPHVPLRNNITARWFIKEFQRDHLPHLQKEADISEGYLPVTNLYKTLVYLSIPVSQYLKTNEDYELRCNLLRSILPWAEESIVDILGNYHDDSYLFVCLFEIIFKSLELSELEREVLNHCFGYSHKYRILSQTDLAEKLKVPKNEVRNAAIAVEKKVNNIIIKFKVLSAYLSYRTNGTLDGYVIDIESDIYEHIREEEGDNNMTNLFICKIISVIFDYEMVVVDCKGRNHYILIKKGMENSSINIKFYRGIKKLLEPGMRTRETEKIVNSIVEYMEEGYVEDADTFMEEEEEYPEFNEEKDTIEEE